MTAIKTTLFALCLSALVACTADSEPTESATVPAVSLSEAATSPKNIRMGEQCYELQCSFWSCSYEPTECP